MINVYIEEEVIAGDKVIIPDGTITYFRIKTEGAKTQNGKTSMMWILEPKDPQYADAPIEADFINISGDYHKTAIDIGKTSMMYALENNLRAHETKNYEVANSKDFNGMEIVGKVKIIVSEWIDKQTGQKRQTLKNKVVHYCSPRPTSKTYKYYEAFLKGEQKWLTGNVPEIKEQTQGSGQHQPSHNLSDEIPFALFLPLIMSMGALVGIA